MDLTKPDEHYVDGQDKWHIRYIVDSDTKINPGDYKETIQIRKNGELVGTKVTRKDQNGNDKMPPYIEGIQDIPVTAKLVKAKK